MTSDQLKYTCISRLLNSEPKGEIAKLLEIPYTTVLRYSKELKEAQANGTLESLIDMDQVMLDSLVDQQRSLAPAGLANEVSSSLDAVKGAKTILEALADDMQITAKTLTTKIKSLANGAENASEIDTLASALCDLQNAFFNKNTTQVNVQNNYDTGQPSTYGNFLDDKPNNIGS